MPFVTINTSTAIRSPSTRRAWIEIPASHWLYVQIRVALHPEGVDRNTKSITPWKICLIVALHPEGVDRNPDAR